MEQKKKEVVFDGKDPVQRGRDRNQERETA